MSWLVGALSVWTVSELTMLTSIGDGSVAEQAMMRNGGDGATSPVLLLLLLLLLLLVVVLVISTRLRLTMPSQTLW